MSDQTPKQARPEELEAAQRFRETVDREIAGFGIIEIAVRNQSVSDYMTHWEGRVATLTARCEALEQEKNDARRTAEYWKAEHLAGNVQCEAQQAINQSVAELVLALSLLRQSGTDPEAWIERAMHRLAALLPTGYTQALDDALKGRP
jgi:hypothetical protein